MTDFNLPPGCSTSDLPGSRPEDERMDRLYDRLEEVLQEFEPEDLPTLLTWYCKGRDNV